MIKFILLFFTLNLNAQKYIKIPGTIFDIDSHVLITKDSVFALRVANILIDSSITLEDFNFRGRVFYKEGREPLLWIPQLNTLEDYSILNHEIFHLVTTILFWAGVQLTSDTEEVYAYMIQYFSKTIYLNLK